MKKSLTATILLLLGIYTQAQIGIGTTTPNSTLDIRGSLSLAVTTFSAATTAGASDNMFLFTGVSATTLTLPTAVGITGRVYWIKNISANASILTIATTAAQTIDGLATFTLPQKNKAISLISNGANWYLGAESLPGSTAWYHGGNTVASIQTIGTISNHDFPIITNNLERMRIDATGNVGIGTTAPTSNLHVANSGSVTSTIAQFLTPALATTNATYLKLGKALTNGDEADILYNWTGANSAANYLGFSFYGKPVYMMLNNAGNVGIGTTTFNATYPERLIVDAGATGNTNYQNVIVGKGNTNSYAQLNIQNNYSGSAAGTVASSDVVATSDNGTETINYIDMGINSSGNNSAGVLGGANTAYLYSTGNDFAIGNGTNLKNLNFFTTTGGVYTERMRIDPNGNVGIGTSSPAAALHVVKSNTGGNVVTVENTSATGYSSVDFYNSSNALSGTFGYGNGSVAAPFTGRDYFNIYGNDFIVANGIASPLFIQGSTNNVGLNNTAPTEKLDVTGNVKFSGALMPNNTAGTAGNFLMSTGSGSAPTWFDASGYAWLLNGNIVASEKTIGTATGSNFALPFITNGTEKMRISNTGEVGIGTATFNGANPEQLIVDAGLPLVAGDYQNVIVGKGNTNSWAQLNIQNTYSAAANSASSDVVATSDNGNENVNYIDMGINSGTNTTNGVYGGANTAYLYTTGNDFVLGNGSANKNLIFFTGGTASSKERIRIIGSGSVGIGTTTPTAVLHLGAGTASVSTAPLKFTAGTNLTTPEAGATEFDGVNTYITNETTSGRGAIPVEQHFKLTAAGTAITNAGGIANYFGTTSNISLASGGIYEIDIYMYYSNTTAGAVTWTLTNSAVPISQEIFYEMSPITGIVAPPGTATMLTGQIYNDATAARTITTGSLTTGVNHYAHFKIFLENGVGTSLKIQATKGAGGSITPGIGSRWYCKRISASNVGTFAP